MSVLAKALMGEKKQPKGGKLTNQLQAMAEKVRKAGHGDDTMLVHVEPWEAQLLDQMTDGVSVNPKTGLPMFEDAGEGNSSGPGSSGSSGMNGGMGPGAGGFGGMGGGRASTISDRQGYTGAYSQSSRLGGQNNGGSRVVGLAPGANVPSVAMAPSVTYGRSADFGMADMGLSHTNFADQTFGYSPMNRADYDRSLTGSHIGDKAVRGAATTVGGLAAGPMGALAAGTAAGMATGQGPGEAAMGNVGSMVGLGLGYGMMSPAVAALGSYAGGELGGRFGRGMDAGEQGQYGQTQTASNESDDEGSQGQYGTKRGGNGRKVYA